jgi:hypothetical protein
MNSLIRHGKKAVFVASTGQHIGKTTTCLALVAGAEQILGKGEIGFIKPVGQKHVVVEGGLKVDKDVVLFKQHFNLSRCNYRDLSPVLIPAGYTKDFLDGKITENEQIAAVERGFRAISSQHKFTGKVFCLKEEMNDELIAHANFSRRGNWTLWSWKHCELGQCSSGCYFRLIHDIGC